jgi:DHA1 family multidrug resistance protein-like MFS transporter
MLLFVGWLNYLVDTYLMYAASAIAANTILRSACGSAAPLFTNQMFTKLGIGGGGSLIGGVATVLTIIPFAFDRWGKQIRMRSKFAPTGLKKAERQKDEEEVNPADPVMQSSSEFEGGASSSSTVAEEEEDDIESPRGEEPTEKAVDLDSREKETGAV